MRNTCPGYKMDNCRRYFEAFGRRKSIDPKKLMVSRFKRNLNIFDLVGIGLGTSLGIGVYVVISYVIKHQAGPSAVISVIIAGVAALLSGLCYSEFATRLPQTGSSYVYVYATLGELSAFVIGWSMILEHGILAATAAKAWSQYFDGLLNGTLHNYIHKHIQWTVSNDTSDSPDLLSCGVILLGGAVCMFNTKVSTTLSFFLTIVNGLVIFCIICVGFFHVRHENWTTSPGFFPFCFTGVISGSATLFSVFSGIDTICSTSEEAKNPLKTVPNAVTTTNILSFILILCVSSALTLSYPWFELRDALAIPHAYEDKGIHGSFLVFSIGGLIGLTAALLACCHGIPRILFSMKTDRLLITCCMGRIEKCGLGILLVFPLLIACALSLFTSLDLLVQMLALGTLITHTFIAICVINTRYQPSIVGLYQEYEDISDEKLMQCTEFVYTSFLSQQPHNNNDIDKEINENGKNSLFRTLSSNTDNRLILSGSLKDSTYKKMNSIVNDTPAGSQSSLFQLPSDFSTEPSSSTSMTSSVALIVFVLSSTVFSFVVMFANDYLLKGAWWTYTCLVISMIMLVTSTVTIAKQPQNQKTLLFRTPYVPFVPLVSMFINVLLMSALSYKAWVRFSVWLFIGVILYLTYGIRHSAEKEIDDQEVVLYEINEQERASIK